MEIRAATDDLLDMKATNIHVNIVNIPMVVNNAGVGGESGSIESQNNKGWQWALDVNLMGVVYGAKVMVPLMKQHDEGGWVVNVASMAGMGGIPYSGAYTATKAAVVALSESWAGELENTGINVSVLCPAFVQTRIYDSERNRPVQYKSDAINSDNKLAAKDESVTVSYQSNAYKITSNKYCNSSTINRSCYCEL